MHKFALEKIEAVKGRQTFFKLKKGAKCFLDDFEAEIKRNGQYVGELASLYAIMEAVSNNQSLPKTKFREITLKKEIIKEYEVKTKNLRLYLIKHTNGKIVVFGGYKNNQKSDIRSFRSLKSQFLSESKNI